MGTSFKLVKLRFPFWDQSRPYKLLKGEVSYSPTLRLSKFSRSSCENHTVNLVTSISNSILQENRRCSSALLDNLRVNFARIIITQSFNRKSGVHSQPTQRVQPQPLRQTPVHFVSVSSRPEIIYPFPGLYEQSTSEKRRHWNHYILSFALRSCTIICGDV